MTQQTAVEWLVMTYNQRQGYIRFEDIDKAKVMEKEQIAEAYRTGVEEDVYNNPLRTGEEYYNETFNN